MKTNIILTYIVTTMYLITGCANAQTPKTSDVSSKEKILITYFSKTGNTKKIAEHIQSLTGGDLIQIETNEEYPQEYQASTEIAKKEKGKRNRFQTCCKNQNKEYK